MNIRHVLKNKCKLFHNGNTVVCPMRCTGSSSRPSDAGQFNYEQLSYNKMVYFVILTSYEDKIGDVERTINLYFMKIYNSN